MDMVLLDWTRMGSVFCLAGIVCERNHLRVVRPLPLYGRDALVRNVGWPADFLHGRCRWEVFELVGPASPEPQPPHLEDVWVQTLRPRQRMAPPDLRRSILQATHAPEDRPLFGAPVTETRSSAFLPPGTGCRSLVSITVPAGQIAFTVAQRDGSAEPDYRVTLPVRGREGRILSVKDHFLLQRVELASPALEGRRRALDLAVRLMGPQVVVRVGLSRPFQATPGRAPCACWLMADGFFSPTDPQP
jgi:hypothetical protein